MTKGLREILAGEYQVRYSEMGHQIIDSKRGTRASSYLTVVSPLSICSYATGEDLLPETETST